MLNVNQVLDEYINSSLRVLETGINVPTFSVFFDPRNEFVNWMKEFTKNKIVVDCGCGRGQAVAVLRHAGLSVIGIDLYGAESPLIPNVHFINAAFFPFTNEHIAMMCRPCRGDWIHATIIKAVESGAQFVYVGKEEHYDADLQPLPYNIEKVLTGAGLQNESVWVVSKT